MKPPPSNLDHRWLENWPWDLTHPTSAGAGVRRRRGHQALVRSALGSPVLSATLPTEHAGEE